MRVLLTEVAVCKAAVNLLRDCPREGARRGARNFSARWAQSESFAQVAQFALTKHRESWLNCR